MTAEKETGESLPPLLLPAPLRLGDGFMSAQLKITGDGCAADFMHPLFDRQVNRVCLVCVEGSPAVEGCDEGEVIGALAVQDILTGFQIEQTFYAALHTVEILYQLGDLLLIFVLDFK